MKIRMSMTQVMMVFAIICSIGVGITLYVTSNAIDDVKITGNLYNKIKLGDGLVADVLPPPAYIIEAYLEVTMILQDPQTVESRRNRLKELQKSYYERYHFWASSPIDKETKYELTVKSHEFVDDFWKILERDFIPAVVKGDNISSRSAYNNLSSLYSEHRKVIGSVVQKADKVNSALEKEAIEIVKNDTNFVIIVGGGSFIIGFLCCYCILA